MATKSNAIKKDTKKTIKVSTNYKITKLNGNVIYRDALSDVEIEAYKEKGFKVEGK